MEILTTHFPILLSVLAFLTVFLFFFGLVQYMYQRSQKREMLQKVQEDYYEGTPLSKSDSNTETKNSALKGVLSLLSSLGRGVMSEKSKEYSAMKIRFLKAGVRNTNALPLFWGTRLCLSVLLTFWFLILRTVLLPAISPTATLIIVIFLILTGWFLPNLWLHMKTAIRKRKIIEGLPDALDLLVVCVEAGMGLDAAINRVGKEIKLSHKELSDELKLLNLEIRAGKSRQEALRNLALRTDIEEVRNLVTVLIQTDKFGTSIAQALRVYSDVFRTKRFQKAEEIAAKLPTKLIFPLVIFIFPSLFVALLGSAAIQIYETVLK
jgi:tight adherence protein C